MTSLPSPTIHQRVHGWMWHWKDGPGWLRSPSPELFGLYNAGMRVLRVQLQDDGIVPKSLVDMWKGMGFKVWGAVEPRGTAADRPTEFAEWVASEKRRLSLGGCDFDFEDQVRAWDIASKGQWSETFAGHMRSLCPNLPCVLDTYFGSAAGGMNLGAYTTRGFRPNIQTYWGAEGTWDDPPTRIVGWCAGATPTIRKGIVKPIIRVSANNSGQLPDQDTVLANWKQSGLIGGAFYYIDALKGDLGEPAQPGNLNWMRNFIQRAISMGVAY